MLILGINKVKLHTSLYHFVPFGAKEKSSERQELIFQTKNKGNKILFHMEGREGYFKKTNNNKKITLLNNFL